MSELHYLRNAPKRFLFDGCKLIYHQQRLQDFLDGKKIRPLHIDMGIHKACNMRCIYCYGIKQKPSRDYIPKDRLLWLAEDAADEGVKSIAVIGDGEPTLNDGLYDFVQYGTDCGLDMSVATNGLLLDEEKLKILTANLKWLRFNVSGVGEGYDKVHTTVNKFPKFEEVIKLAVKYRNKCTIGLQMVLIPQSFDQVIPLAKKALEWGVDYLVIKQFSDGGVDMPIHFDIDSYTNVKPILEYAEGLSNESTKIIVKWSAMADSRSITVHNKWGFDRCIDLPLIFQISGNGNCYPSGYMFGDNRYCYGNINRTRLKDIFAGKRYWHVIRKVANTPLKKLCTGQCRHCETLKFMDKLTKAYKGDLQEALIEMCGSRKQYERIMRLPPEHVNFI